MSGQHASSLPWVVSSTISIFTVCMTGLGLWFSKRAQERTSSLQDNTERVKAEQHLVEILQAENERIREAWSAEVKKAQDDCVQELNRAKGIIVDELGQLKEALRLEREAHDLTRHRYISDVSALRGIVRDEITKAAAQDTEDDVRDIMNEARPDPIGMDQIWPEQGDYQ